MANFKAPRFVEFLDALPRERDRQGREGRAARPFGCRHDRATYESIRYDGPDAGGVARITLHRPERLNAFTNLMQRELCAAFDRVDADPEVARGRRDRLGSGVLRGRRSRLRRAHLLRRPRERTAIPAASSRCASSTAPSR